MRRTRHLCALAAAAVLVSARPVPSDDGSGGVASPPAPGMRAHVDPQTGALVPAPPPSTRPAALPSAAYSTEGLVVTTAPGGGVMLDLQGRFQSRLVATVMPDGSIRMSHADAAE